MNPETLRAERHHLGLTGDQMAERLNTPPKTYQNWEQGRTRPPGCLSVALACILNHPPEKKL